jgi:hypothetical protein
MTACADLYKKWKKEPNFCGLGKEEANTIDKYIDFVDEFSKEFEIPEDVIYRNAPRTAIKPILRFRKDSDIRRNVSIAIAETLKSKHAITTKFVNVTMGVPLVPKKMVEEPKVIVAPLTEPHKEIIATNLIKDKIRMLNAVLTPGQMAILQKVAAIENLNNEYEALAKVLIWVKDRA